MYPTLFNIGTFRIDTYSVVWFIALSIAILWALKRLKLYELDEDESRKIMAVAFLCMLVGARAPEYIRNWRVYYNHPSLLLDLNRGGVEEFGAILGAFSGALFMSLFSKKISFAKLCEVAAIPALMAIVIGRWGCFLNGCCKGIESKFFTTVHFLNDPPGITRHPVQIYYSIFAACSVILLLIIERRILSRQKIKFYPVIAPLALILFSIMRYIIAPVREYATLYKLINNYWVYKGITIFLPIEILFLAWSLYKMTRRK